MRTIVPGAETNQSFSIKVTPGDRKVLFEMGEAAVTAQLQYWCSHEDERRRFNYLEIARRIKARRPVQVARDIIVRHLEKWGVYPSEAQFLEFKELVKLRTVIFLETGDWRFLALARRGLLESEQTLAKMRPLEKVEDIPLEITLRPYQAMALRIHAYSLGFGPCILGRLIVQEEVLMFSLWQAERRRKSA